MTRTAKLLCMTACLAGHAAAEPLVLRTGDGLILGLRTTGAFEALRSGEANVLSPGGMSGIWARDARTGAEEQFTGSVEPRARGFLFTGYAKKLELKISVEILPEDGAIRFKGAVENLSAGERGVDLEFRLYCDARGARWPRDVQVAETIGAKPPARNTTYPFHGLVLPSNRGAFALAVSPQEPAMFEFGYEKFYFLTLKYGLSKHASGRLHLRAPFETLLYRTDPEWGFRSVVERYYRLHERWFQRRAMKNGMWLFYRPNAEQVPNPGDYAYHADTGRGVSQDHRHGILNLPYHLPGQREFVRLPTLPERYEDQMKVLDEFEQKYTRHISPRSIYQVKNLDRELVRSSGLHDAQGKLRAFTRNTEWGGPSLTFILNPSPDLFKDRPGVTMGKLSMEWARWQLKENSQIDGLMIDSLFGWGRYFNCRQEHFPYARIALTYDPEFRLPALSNQFSHQEYLWALRGLLEPKCKLLMGNGLRPGRFFNGMELDVLTSENPVRAGKEDLVMGADTVGGGERESVGLASEGFRNLIFDRIVAYQKPFLIVDHHPEDWNDLRTVEYFWKIGLFFGVYPGFNWRYQIDAGYYEKHKGLINRYLPLLKEISAAGWEPIPYAKSGNPKVWIERYGSQYFTVMNVANSRQQVTLSLQPEPLHLTAGFQCSDLTRSGAAPAVSGKEIRLALEADEVKVLRLSLLQ